MKITLYRSDYSGVDGSSLSDIRCKQIVDIYNLLETLGSKKMSYVDIQEEAEEKNIFGDTKAKSAVRTFFPLLKKLHFVDYGEKNSLFAANKCFTELGKQFVLVCVSLERISPDTPNAQEIKKRLINMKEDLQKEGLLNMLNDPEYKDHNIKIALELLKVFRIIDWNEFLYALHSIGEGHTIEDAINDIRLDRRKIDQIEFVNEKGNALPNTCYSYLRSLLVEAGLVVNINASQSKLTDDGIIFVNHLHF